MNNRVYCSFFGLFFSYFLFELHVGCCVFCWVVTIIETYSWTNLTDLVRISPLREKKNKQTMKSEKKVATFFSHFLLLLEYLFSLLVDHSIFSIFSCCAMWLWWSYYLGICGSLNPFVLFTRNVRRVVDVVVVVVVTFCMLTAAVAGWAKKKKSAYLAW